MENANISEQNLTVAVLNSQKQLLMVCQKNVKSQIRCKAWHCVVRAC